jgi:hypothetical protein
MACLILGPTQCTPASQLDPLRKRLPALQKLVDALQPEIPRVDPIAVLPEEVLVAVMEMVITEDPKMAPRYMQSFGNLVVP